VVVAHDTAEDLRKLLEACEEMLDHYCSSGRTDDAVAHVMRESRSRLEERLQSAEAGPVVESGND